MAKVEVKGLTKKYGSITALDNIDLEIPEGALMSLLGPSGCGKTTAIRLIAGFEKPDSGDIFIDGEKVNDIPVNKRNIGVVFQSYALFPHMTVKENAAYGLQQRKLPKKEIERRTAEVIELVKLTGCESRKPKQLSGGQQQRVALARALVIRPKILLLDECLSALDKKLRVEMQSELKRILEASGITALFVTHDQEEALTLSDYIVVMNEGRIVQTGRPFEVYERPKNSFVASFLGKANIISRDKGNKKAVYSIRPEKVKMYTEAPPGVHTSGIIEFITYAGNITTYTIDCGGKKFFAEEQNTSRNIKFKTGMNVFIGWDEEDCVPMEDE